MLISQCHITREVFTPTTPKVAGGGYSLIVIYPAVKLCGCSRDVCVLQQETLEWPQKNFQWELLANENESLLRNPKRKQVVKRTRR
jgi:hypothetical protein